MIIELIIKFLKFGIVGLSGTAIDFLFTWICKEKLKWNKFISNSIGFSIAATSNYILNRIWTFESNNPEVSREYLSFFFISSIGLALNNLFVFLFNEKLKFNFYLSKAFAITLVAIWNFIPNYLFTFR
ncbi:putative membrane protein [Fermentimonas caenicola]|jgi:putative flippase GtrA|uniref:Putative membrane protein n=1 Tax=Fermentimonas caenicola TaxID=1562970 RepID=A0A098C354_9BACT|nr:MULTISPECIES: GtrA family protein [Lascolabacillus]MDD2606439.1 GtrA family protein [Lascolabacillus sp.]MDD4757738.1 GtrA family protein [Lascolabacillus sp.]CEA16848.1 putative membrane protein [Fermentimonas caenicola]